MAKWGHILKAQGLKRWSSCNRIEPELLWLCWTVGWKEHFKSDAFVSRVLAAVVFTESLFQKVGAAMGIELKCSLWRIPLLVKLFSFVNYLDVDIFLKSLYGTKATFRGADLWSRNCSYWLLEYLGHWWCQFCWLNVKRHLRLWFLSRWRQCLLIVEAAWFPIVAVFWV